MRIVRSALWLGAGVLALAAGIPAAEASGFTYTYTGGPFDEPGASVSAPYTSSDFLTGSFTLSSALGANLPSTDESSFVTSYTVSDGVNTWNQTDSTLQALNFATDSLGNIDLWSAYITAGTGGLGNAGGTWGAIGGAYVNVPVYGYSFAAGGGGNEGVAGNYYFSAPAAVAALGSWESPAPEPSTMVLMGTCGLVLFLAVRPKAKL